MRSTLRLSRQLLLISALCGLSVTAAAPDHRGIAYEVTITNITQAQTFTPQLVAVHTDAVRLFDVGAPASEAVEILAEAGDTGPGTELLAAAGREVASANTIPGLLGPGESVSMAVDGSGRARYNPGRVMPWSQRQLHGCATWRSSNPSACGSARRPHPG